MSFWDNVKKFTQPYADDDYEEYDDEEGVSYETEEPEAASSSFGHTEAEPAEEKTAFDFGMSSGSSAAPAGSSGFSGQVVGTGAGGKQQVILFRPNSFQDATKAADDLHSKKAVVANMENVDQAMARRVVDFLSGCAYSLGGSVRKIASFTYLFCPYNMDIVGDFDAIQPEVDNYV